MQQRMGETQENIGGSESQMVLQTCVVQNKEEKKHKERKGVVKCVNE